MAGRIQGIQRVEFLGWKEGAVDIAMRLLTFLPVQGRQWAWGHGRRVINQFLAIYAEARQ
ncbi:hypothetical protein CHU95_08490 [Niveispirillum lacus]|uniref:Uncharacterized protein n=1 Tax=Niveispirillum lacus TaxID=1981099 RepID=A0A255Z2V6_9PROT|nr:hypothetical protein CHU95_08490 [Niveispirillum lacus]